MRFQTAELDLLNSTREVLIETTSPAGDTHQTIIWVVVDQDEVFIRSYRGATARWYREAMAHREVALIAGGHRIPARSVPALDPSSVARTSAGLQTKYAGDPSTPPMVRSEVLDTTLRLDPL